MYDLLIVGAGLTAATLAARLKDRFQICVLESRNHIGGNCFDELSEGTYLQRYGPHILHTSNAHVMAFLGAFARWTPYEYQVVAEVHDGAAVRCVPFPYSRQTAEVLGRTLSRRQILALFFKDYSQKMWGLSWGQLPAPVRRRVPKDTQERSCYYDKQVVALPRQGYTRMIQAMLEGVELILQAPGDAWTQIQARAVVYTGRPDQIPWPGGSTTIARHHGLDLGYRALDIHFAVEPWPHAATSLHACTLDRPWTRKTAQARLTGGQSSLVSTEWPRPARPEDLAPGYPMGLSVYRQRYRQLAGHIHQYYPNVYLAGRLGRYRYLNMDQAVAQGLVLAEKLWKKLSSCSCITNWDR